MKRQNNINGLVHGHYRIEGNKNKELREICLETVQKEIQLMMKYLILRLNLINFVGGTQQSILLNIVNIKFIMVFKAHKSQ